MKTRKEYKVIHPFRDLQDISREFPNGRRYAVGDIYLAAKHSQERIDELLGTSNRIGRGLIKVVEVQVDLDEYTVEKLKDMAKEKELKGYSNMNKEELISLLEGE